MRGQKQGGPKVTSPHSNKLLGAGEGLGGAGGTPTKSRPRKMGRGAVTVAALMAGLSA